MFFYTKTWIRVNYYYIRKFLMNELEKFLKKQVNILIKIILFIFSINVRIDIMIYFILFNFLIVYTKNIFLNHFRHPVNVNEENSRIVVYSFIFGLSLYNVFLEYY